MRKFLLILSIIFISMGVFIGCGDKPSISCDIKEISIYQNQEFTLKDKLVNVENYEDGYTIEIADESIAKVVDNRIIAKSVGKTKLKLMLDGYEEVFTEIDVTIKEGFVAKWISVDSPSVTINLGHESIKVNKINFNSNCTEVPVITYDEDIIHYDYLSGKITAIETGNTIVNISFAECQASFEVYITDVVYVESMTVDSSMQLFKNTTGKLTFGLFPSKANTYRFWTDSNILSITDKGYYQTFETGEAEINYQYYTSINDVSPVLSFKIIVVDSTIEYDISILDDQMISVSNYMLDKDYYLVINCLPAVHGSLFSLSSNINIKSTMSWVDDYGYIIKFNFINKGNNKIDVYYNPISNNDSLEITRSIEVAVYSENDISLAAKWDIYIVSPNPDDGKYRIYKDNTSYLYDYLEFCLLLGDTVYNKPFDLYIENIDGSLIETNKLFYPDDIGEYKFVAKIGEEIIDRVVVLVLYE